MSQNEFNQKVIEHLIALGERLESIERMLKPKQKEAAEMVHQSECLIRVADAQGMSLMPDGSDPMQCGLQYSPEPEWRPMSTAPSNGLIQAKLKSNGKIIKIEQNGGLWMEDGYYLYRPDVFEGWRPL